MQALSVATTENWPACLGHYRRRGDAPYKKRYAYVPNNSQTALLASYQNGSDTAYTYTYDDNGNITSISQGGSTTYYTYDRLNELIREDNATLNQSWTYTYDVNGNLLNKKRYAYVPNGGALGACLETISYGYDAAHQDWADQLTSYNGEAIRYDDSGNPISYRGYTMAWQGKRLTSAAKTGTAITYSYDENGIRTQKSVNGVATNYYYNGSLLISMTQGTDTLLFSYDASGSVVSVNFNGTDYYYIRNGQGDVIKLIDGSGNTVTEYTYDTWGKLLSCTGSLSATLGTLNPFRYRGYVYDTETGWYYLQSRYYDPEVGRFISADVLLSTGQGVLGHNTFAYCNNNPVNAEDAGGCIPTYNVMETDGGHTLRFKSVEEALAHYIRVTKGRDRNGEIMFYASIHRNYDTARITHEGLTRYLEYTKDGDLSLEELHSCYEFDYTIRIYSTSVTTWGLSWGMNHDQSGVAVVFSDTANLGKGLLNFLTHGYMFQDVYFVDRDGNIRLRD